MAPPADVPPGSRTVVPNPDEDCSPEAFRTLLDELLTDQEPELDSLGAAQARRDLRDGSRGEDDGWERGFGGG
ncbi:MAG: hypothetical protein ACYDGN_17875 [Acidimicrobiales bacterium]